MATSKQYQEIISLGKKLVQEFETEERRDTTLQWMAHYLAELMQKLEQEKSAQNRKQLQKECEEIILNIWQRRAHFPGRIRPLSGLKDVLPVINALQDHPNDLSWERHISYENAQPWGKFMRSVRQATEEMLEISLVATVVPEALTKEKEWLEHASLLSETERKLIKYLDSKLSQRQLFNEVMNRGSSDKEIKASKDKIEKVISLLEENIASQVKSLERLKSSLNGKNHVPENSSSEESYE